jgi:uncharacterized membrane protein YfcA
MTSPGELAVVAVMAFVAAALAAVTGFGGAVVLLPVLAWAFGVRDAVPILTVAQLIGNGWAASRRTWAARTTPSTPIATPSPSTITMPGR